MEVNMMKYDYDKKKFVEDRETLVNKAISLCDMFDVDSVYEIEKKIGEDFDFEYDKASATVYLVANYKSKIDFSLVGEILTMKIVRICIEIDGIKIYFQHKQKVYIKNYSFFNFSSPEEGFKNQIYKFLNDLEINLNGFIITMENFGDIAKLIVGKRMYIPIKQYGVNPYLDTRGGKYVV